MSRVFEALTRAGDEKQRQSEWPVEKIGSTLPAEALVAKPPTSDPYFRANGTVGRANGTVSEAHEFFPGVRNGDKSWRERIEEWLFGWDLRGYSNYQIVAFEKDSAASEQYKMLREQIKRLRAESGIRNFCVTSPVKNDGKTTVAVNLAAALSLDYEEKVVLIDGDLRAPSVHRYFNLEPSPGLAEYLSSNSHGSVTSLVRQTFLGGLRVLPAGRPTDFSSELLAKEKMKQVLDEIRAEFPGHMVIVDSPPVLSTPDPLVLARQLDGVLMVIRAGKTPRDYLTKALQSLNSEKLMGVVLNGADLGISSKYYYYSTNGADR
jgi:protein-tyrosine kinase